MASMKETLSSNLTLSRAASQSAWSWLSVETCLSSSPGLLLDLLRAAVSSSPVIELTGDRDLDRTVNREGNN